MILLDTHVLLWLAKDPAKLSKPATLALRKASKSAGLSIASITLWEIALLITRGRIRAQGTVQGFLQQLVEASRVRVREITPEVAALAMQFPDDFPADPGDRLIAATARADGATLVTADQRIQQSPLVATLW